MTILKTCPFCDAGSEIIFLLYTKSAFVYIYVLHIFIEVTWMSLQPKEAANTYSNFLYVFQVP